MLRALITIRTPAGESYDFRIGRPRILIGRRVDCDLALPTPEVSSHHAELRLNGPAGQGQPARITITDLSSKNGTFVGGRRLEPGVPVALESDAEVEIANVGVRARWLRPEEDDSQSLSLDTSSSLSRSLLRGLLGEAVRKSRARVEVRKGPARGGSLAIVETAEHVRLGVGPDVDLDLGERKLTDNPLLIVLGGHGYYLVPPLGVPVRVGDRHVGETVTLRSGDVIALLKTRLVFVDPLQGAIDDLARLEGGAESETRPAADARQVETVRQPMVSARRFRTGERVILVIAILSLLAALGFLAVVLEIIEL